MVFEQKRIEDIEKHLTDLKQLSNDAMAEFYLGLKYLEKTKRYKENKRYKTASFWTYIDDIFQIKQTAYRENIRALMNHPDKTKKYGVGLVSKVMRTCKSEAVEKVFADIETKQEKRKTPVSREQIEEIIQSYANDKAKITKTMVDWRAMYEAEKIAHGQTRELLSAAYDELAELRDRCEKLKWSAAGFIDVKRIVQKATELSTKQSKALHVNV